MKEATLTSNKEHGMTAQQEERSYDALHNEGGEGYNPHRSAARREREEYAAIANAKRNTAAVAEWTLDTTKTRREIWNTLIRNNANAIKSGSMSIADLSNRAGFAFSALKNAIATHNL